MTAKWVAPNLGKESLAALCQLGAVANVDQHGVALGDHVDGLLAGDLRHNGIGGIVEGFGCGGHGVGPSVMQVRAVQCGTTEGLAQRSGI